MKRHIVALLGVLSLVMVFLSACGAKTESLPLMNGYVFGASKEESRNIKPDNLGEFAIYDTDCYYNEKGKLNGICFVFTESKNMYTYKDVKRLKEYVESELPKEGLISYYCNGPQLVWEYPEAYYYITFYLANDESLSNEIYKSDSLGDDEPLRGLFLNITSKTVTGAFERDNDDDNKVYATDETFKYQDLGGGYCFLGFANPDNNIKYLRIPATFNGKPVIAIAEKAFYGNKTLETVIVESGITEIRSATFYGCENLITVELPDGITALRREAFRGCGKLKDFVIPKTVRIMEGSAFEGCHSLTTMVIPEGVERIEGSLFYDCKNLVSVTIPKSVNYIDVDWSFGGCSALKRAYVAEGSWAEKVFKSAFSRVEIWYDEDTPAKNTTPTPTPVSVNDVAGYEFAIKNDTGLSNWNTSETLGTLHGYVGDAVEEGTAYVTISIPKITESGELTFEWWIETDEEDGVRGEDIHIITSEIPEEGIKVTAKVNYKFKHRHENFTLEIKSHYFGTEKTQITLSGYKIIEKSGKVYTLDNITANFQVWDTCVNYTDGEYSFGDWVEMEYKVIKK